MKGHLLRARLLVVGWAVFAVAATAAGAPGDLRVSRIVVTPDYVVPHATFTIQVWVRNVVETQSADFDLRVTVKQSAERVGALDQFYVKDDGKAQRVTGLGAQEERLVHSRADWRVDGQGDCTVIVWLKPMDGPPVEEVHRFTLPPAGPIQSYPISTDRTGGLEPPEIIVFPEVPTANSPFSIRMWMRNRGARPWDEFSLIVRVRRIPQQPGEREEWYVKEERPIRCQAIPGATAALMYSRGDWAVNDPGVYEVVLTIQREKSDDWPHTRRFAVR